MMKAVPQQQAVLIEKLSGNRERRSLRRLVDLNRTVERMKVSYVDVSREPAGKGVKQCFAVHCYVVWSTETAHREAKEDAEKERDMKVYSSALC